VTLRAATRQPHVFGGVIAHEPPLFPLLASTELEPALVDVQRRIGAFVELLERGDDEHAARLVVETIALGPGAWEGELTPEMREVFIANAPTFLDEVRDPEPGSARPGSAAASLIAAGAPTAASPSTTRGSTATLRPPFRQ
jgi:hypothetical protein